MSVSAAILKLTTEPMSIQSAHTLWQVSCFVFVFLLSNDHGGVNPPELDVVSSQFGSFGLHRHQQDI